MSVVFGSNGLKRLGAPLLLLRRGVRHHARQPWKLLGEPRGGWEVQLGLGSKPIRDRVRGRAASMGLYRAWHIPPLHIESEVGLQDCTSVGCSY